MRTTTLSIASDHGGFEQKQQLVAWLEEQGCTVYDRGCDSDASVDYPDYAVLVCKDVVAGTAELGILVCGTGIGMSIAANKVDGIRAANVTQPSFAELCRQHNNANIITLSGRFVDLETNKEILENYIDTPFEGGRHERRVAKIMELQ